MKFLLIGLVCLLAFLGQLEAASHSRSLAREWAAFKRLHGKHYARPEEEARRFANFRATKALIERHNANASHSYKMGLNHLADWDESELARLTGANIKLHTLNHRQRSESDIAFLSELLGDESEKLPTEVDWRKVEGRVSPVKSQGACGSCWAFATTGLLEGQQVARNVSKQIVPLSEQDLVDCSKSNYGCNGGWMPKAIDDIHSMGGIMSERDYPYTGQENSTCHYGRSKSIMSVVGSTNLNGEEELERVVVKYGPVAVAIYVSSNFQAYESGVFEDDHYNHYTVNHAVLVVGYGVDPTHGHYWIVKNSWSDSWGENGYVRIKRGVNMINIGSHPVIAKF